MKDGLSCRTTHHSMPGPLSNLHWLHRLPSPLRQAWTTQACSASALR